MTKLTKYAMLAFGFAFTLGGFFYNETSALVLGVALGGISFGMMMVNQEKYISHLEVINSLLEQQVNGQRDTVAYKVKKIVDRQCAKGMGKYGRLLDDNPLNAIEVIEHAQEELVDMLQYLEKLKDVINGNP